MLARRTEGAGPVHPPDERADRGGWARLGDSTTPIVVGFALAYVVCFLVPVFFNRTDRLFMPEAVPALVPIGADTRQFIEYVDRWRVQGDPYVGTNAHPPLMHVFLLPVAWLGQRAGYRLLLALTLVAFAASLALARRWKPSRAGAPLDVFFGLTGLFSYGLLFEMERGQFNVAATALALGALYLFHANPRLRPLSWLGLFVATQLKMFPGIFVLGMIDPGLPARRNALAIGAFLAANVAALFALGPRVFEHFVAAMAAQAQHPYVWVGNASIRAFAELRSAPAALGPLLLLLYAGLLGAVFVASWRRVAGLHLVGPPATLILVAAVGGILIPPVSHDYKLATLVVPTLLFFREQNASGVVSEGRLRGILWRAGLTLVALGYAVSSYSFALRHVVIPRFENNVPTLLLIAAGAALAEFASGPARAADSQPAWTTPAAAPPGLG